MDNVTVFTPAAVLGLLSEIEELKDKSISLMEHEDGTLSISVGETQYNLVTDDISTVVVDNDAMEELSDIRDDSYEQLEESGIEVEEAEAVQGGILKEIAKTLFIGGMVRLSNKMLAKDQYKEYEKQAKKGKRW